MKGIVEQYAKGEFNIERPEVVISENFFKLNIEAGTVYEGSFIIESKNNYPIKGMVYDSRYILRFETHTFVSKRFEVKYSLDATCLEAGQNYRGHINVITDGGEFKIPYDIDIVMPCVRFYDNKIDDLFKFAALAESNWNEAARLFVHDDFKRTFINKEKFIKQIYESLLESQSVNQALEEFLVFVHKKRAVTLSVSKAKIDVEMPEELSKIVINVNKNTWGYTYSDIKSDSEFIIPAKKSINATDFTGNMCGLEVYISPEHIPEGENSGKIIIENIYQKIEIDIHLTKPVKVRVSPQAMTKNHIQKKSRIKLTRAYLDFRMNKISLEEYVEISLDAFRDLARLEPEEDLYRLGIMHMHILSGDLAKVEQEFLRIEADVDRNTMSSQQKCYYNYLKAMVLKDEETIEKTANMIKRNYRTQEPKMFYFWLLLFVDNVYAEDKNALYREIDEMYEDGENSAIMYLEMCEMLNNNPMLLKKLSGLEITTIKWGLRNNYISDEVLNEFITLAGKNKEFNKQIFDILQKIYDKNNEEMNDEVLKSICSMLIGANMLDYKYHRFYKAAVEKSLKFIGLNECYIRSMNRSKYELIPASVLMYLNYKNTLTEDELAYLYANVIYNKSEHMKIYHEYSSTMEDFMENMIIKGRVNDDLTVIYDEFLEPETVSSMFAGKLVNIIFRRKLVCYNKGVRAVIVTHEELENVQRVPLVNGEAYVEILSDGASIIFEDNRGNRYAGSIPYHLERIVDEKAYMNICREYSPKDYRVLLFNYMSIGEFTYKNAKEVNAAREIVNCDEISYHFKQQACLNIIEYYHENLDTDVLTKYLAKLDIEYLTHANARTIITYLIDMNMFDKAFQAVKLYGFNELDVNELYRLADYGVRDSDGFVNENLMSICLNLYKTGTVNANILTYIINNFKGSIGELTELFKLAKDKVHDIALLAENTLAQMLFASSYIEYIYDIFSTYYNGRSRGLVVKAFLRYSAHNYLIKDMQIPSYIFDCLYLEIMKGNIDDEISKMALLLYFSKLERYTDDQKEWISENVDRFMDAGKILPFYKSFASFVTLPQDVYLKTYLIYKTENIRQVYVSYSFDTGTRNRTALKTERLEEMLPGLYVKEFVVFHGERLVYKIVDDEYGNAQVVESEVLKTKSFNKEDKNRFEMINSMLVKQEMREDSDLLEALDIYLNTVHLFEENLEIL